MNVTAHDTFVALYYALEAATDEFTNQGLATFVQDCDPFVWKDRLSADPAVYAAFSEAYSNRFGEGSIPAEEARLFCRAWLKEQADRHDFYDGPLVEAFDFVATPETWEAALESL